MSLGDRLRRLERRLKVLQVQPRRCATCRSPVPCLPSLICLVPEGLMVETAPCPTCGGPGGGDLAIPYEPGQGITGARRPVVVVAGMSLEEWFARNGESDFGPHLDALFNWLRSEAELG